MYASCLPQTAFLLWCSTFSSLTVYPGYVQLLILISNDDYYSFCFISNQWFWFSLANLGTSRWFGKSDKSWADICCYLKKKCSDPVGITSDFSCCFLMLSSPPAAVVAFSNSVASPVCSSLFMSQMTGSHILSLLHLLDNSSFLIRHKKSVI